MKSKIDEVKDEIKRLYFNEQDVLPKYYEVIEKLRPYVELGEIIADEYDQEWKDDYINERIKQIKDIKDGK